MISIRIGFVLAVADRDVLDRGGGEGVDAEVAALERDARAALLHVERVGDAEDAGLERERLAVGAVADDPLQDLRDDHRPVGLVVDPVEELAQLRLGEEEAEVLVPVAVHRTCRRSG